MTVDHNTSSTSMNKPTTAQRLWRYLGFGHRYDLSLTDWRTAEPEWWTPGALVTETEIILDWKDRLRVLVSGRCSLHVSTRTDVPITRSESRSLFSVLPPTKG